MKNYIDTINPYTFTGSAVIIGLILINELTPPEQASVGNWLQLVGLTIQTYASQKSAVDNITNNNNQNNNDIDIIKKTINKINEELDNLKNNNAN